jgi:chlorobactene glucosyltransferase
VTVSALVVLITYGLIASFWKLLHLLMFFYKPHRYFLGKRSPQLQGKDGPLVSIILPAKDEAKNIGTCVRSLLAAEYTHFELLVVDDRSSDGTTEAAAQAAAGDPRVRLLRVRELPPGWTGKMNAVHQALAAARGAIILIVDADSWHSPRALGAAVSLMERKKVALVSLLPRIEHRSWFGRLVQPVFGTLLMFWKPLPWVNSRKRKHMALGWGGFLMVRRTVLDEVGGVEMVRGRFAADIALVSRVKSAGRRIRILHAPELISTYFYDSPRSVINGWTRLLRITADNRPLLLVLSLAAILVLSLSAYGTILLGAMELLRGSEDRFYLLLGGMGVMHLLFQLTLFGRFYRIGGSSPWYALGHLPAMLVAGYLTALTLVRTRNAHLSWRGTRYQLTADGGARSSC